MFGTVLVCASETLICKFQNSAEGLQQCCADLGPHDHFLWWIHKPSESCTRVYGLGSVSKPGYSQRGWRRRSYLPRCGLAEEVRRKPQLEKRMRNAPPIAAAADVVTKQRSSSPSSWLSLSKLLPRQILQLPLHTAATKHRLCVMGCLFSTLRL